MLLEMNEESHWNWIHVMFSLDMAMENIKVLK
jgi:hypothetical protein